MCARGSADTITLRHAGAEAVHGRTQPQLHSPHPALHPQLSWLCSFPADVLLAHRAGGLTSFQWCGAVLWSCCCAAVQVWGLLPSEPKAGSRAGKLAWQQRGQLPAPSKALCPSCTSVFPAGISLHSATPWQALQR